MKHNDHGTLLVGYDFSRGTDVGVVIIGKKKEGEVMDVINAYQGEKALKIFKDIVGDGFISFVSEENDG